MKEKTKRTLVKVADLFAWAGIGVGAAFTLIALLRIPDEISRQTLAIERQTTAQICLQVWGEGRFPEECEDLLEKPGEE